MGSRKKITVGFRYRMGLHFVLARTLDRVDEIIVGERVAWKGPAFDDRTINIRAWDLFGGDKREGGVEGAADVMFGGAAQGQNSYLVKQLGPLLPAFRGVVSLVFKGGRVTGNNPYVKPWWFRGQRIHTTHDGSAQWYAAKAAIPIPSSIAMPVSTVLEANFNVNALTNAATSANGMKAVAAYDLQNVLASDVVTLWPWHGGTYNGFSYWGVPAQDGPSTGSSYRLHVVKNNDSIATTIGPEGPFDGYQAAFDAANAGAPYTLTGATRYRFGIVDTPVSDNSGGMSWYVQVRRGASGYDSMNPAHIIRECLTDPYMRMNYPASMIDDASFTAAADAFYAEGMGLNFFWTNQAPIKEFVQMVLDHCGAVCYADPFTGKFVLTAIRGDYDVASLESFDESSIISVESFERSGAGEVVNEITVGYFDVQTGKDAVVTVQDLASVYSQGAVLAETRQYPGIGHAALAARVAQRDLTASTSALARLKVHFTRRAATLRPGSVIKFNWAKLGLSDLVCRVLDVDYGTLSESTIVADLVEDVFGLPASSYQSDQPSGWEYADDTPLPVADQHALEGTYWDVVREASTADFAALSDTSGFVYTLAEAANPSQYSYGIYSRIEPAAFELAQEGMSFAPKSSLTVAVDRDDTTITIDDDGTGELGQNIAVGDRLLLPGGRTEEQMEVTDLSGLATGVIGVSRAVLDTTPQEFAIGTDVWLLEFDEEDFGRDSVERFDGDTVDYKLLSASGRGDSPIELAEVMSLTYDSRLFRPYPPGKIRINGEAFPAGDVFGGFSIDWAHRDREQQTASFISQDEDSIGPEAGTTYNVYFYDADTETLMHSATAISGTTYSLPDVSGSFDARLEIEAERDGAVSWERQIREFPYVGSYPLRGAMLIDSGSTALAASATTAISWDTEVRDDGDYFSSGSPTQFTVPTGEGGWYFATWNHVVDLGASAWLLSTQVNLTDTASGLTSSGFMEAAVLTTYDQPRCVAALDRFPAGATFICNGIRTASGSGTPTIEGGGAFRIARVYANPIVGALVRRSAAQAIPSNSDEVIIHDEEPLDDGGMYAAVAPTRLTCPAGGAGWYIVNGHLRWPTTGAAGFRNLSIRRNGATTEGYIGRKSYMAGTVSATSGSMLACVVYLADGDYVELVCRQGTGSAVNTNGAVLSACRTGTTASTLGGAVRHNGSAQTVNAGGDVVIAFDTEVRDDGAMVDLAANSTRITATADGYYAITASVTLTVSGSATNHYCFLRLDGTTEIARDGSHSAAAGNAIGCTPFTVIYLTAGQYVEVLARVGANGVTGTGNAQSRLSAALLAAA